jgi:thiamine-monophosphate kinase
MMSERSICELLSSMLPSGRLNECFESDAEVIELNGARCLFTTDEFSAEDLFREDNPCALGWNIAVGAISDILACGGVPRFYAHALTVDARWDKAYVTRFGEGVRDVLEATGARFIGGDCGRAREWRCTASVLGTCEQAPVLRRGAAAGELIYLSGRIGAGNLEAALRENLGQPVGRAVPASRNTLPIAHAGGSPGRLTLPQSSNQFVLRLRESALMRQYATACIDTSDGVWSALDTIANLNACGYAVAGLPYLEAGRRFCATAGLPESILFFGQCGEYELLFTIKPEREPAFLNEARQNGLAFCRLGQLTPAGRVLREKDGEVDLASLDLQARDFASPQEYLAALLGWLGKQKSTRIGKTGRNR